MYAEDTIAAIATPPGHGGVGIIRVSGPLSSTIAPHLFAAGRQVAVWTSHRLYHGHVRDEDGSVLDEGLAVLMRRPRSYTGEDVLEIHCHGSPVVLRRVLAHALRRGARVAEAGEFTRRAFLNGRMDLAQAEAVLDIVRARTGSGAAVAARQLTGQLSGHLTAIRAQLVELKALLEAQIDFIDDEVVVADDRINAAFSICETSLRSLSDTFRQGVLLREGLRVAIVGKPNVGKSSLLNALLGEERAIVTPMAGTTRDAIEETVDFDGVPVVLTDTAGLRATDEAEEVERLGMARTTAKMAASHLLLAVLDTSAPLDDADRAALRAAASVSHIIVLNKIDLPRRLADAELSEFVRGQPVVALSATTHLGLPALRRSLVELAGAQTAIDPSAPALTNLRHRDALGKARTSLLMAHESLMARRPVDLVAVDVQDAIDYLGEIAGAITNEDVLDRIFSQFCIGK
ncbi:MAG: tRNA uridine-5-carboxymethylaminomethyl(34) synthesis GTPase MnmE [Candidatus Binatia bacterium]